MTETRGRRIYHLLAATQWAAAADAGGPVAVEQFERHGFVHCCTREQIVEIAQWWLVGEAPLIALEVDADVAGDVRFERADLGRYYPHVYNPIPRAAALRAVDLPTDADGTVVLPPALAHPPPRFKVRGVFQGRPVEITWQGGALDGDPDVVARASATISSGATVPQFPSIDKPAGTASPYEAFCLLVAVLDEVTEYRGDGFFEDER